MQVPVAEYLVEARSPGSWPEPGPLELAFAGRSNVGKSSLLNVLCDRKALARTSAKPGRTRGLVFYRVAPAKGPEVRFVDLPGYGYAQVSKTEREAWRKLIEAFLWRRETLAAVVVIIDARRGVEEMDLQLCEWLTELGRPYVVVVTKLDKLPSTRQKSIVDRARKDLEGAGLPASELVGFSAVSRQGRERLWEALLRRHATHGQKRAS